MFKLWITELSMTETSWLLPTTQTVESKPTFKPKHMEHKFQMTSSASKSSRKLTKAKEDKADPTSPTWTTKTKQTTKCTWITTRTEWTAQTSKSNYVDKMKTTRTIWEIRSCSCKEHLKAILRRWGNSQRESRGWWGTWRMSSKLWITVRFTAWKTYKIIGLRARKIETADSVGAEAEVDRNLSKEVNQESPWTNTSPCSH